MSKLQQKQVLCRFEFIKYIWREVFSFFSFSIHQSMQFEKEHSCNQLIIPNLSPKNNLVEW